MICTVRSHRYGKTLNAQDITKISLDIVNEGASIVVFAKVI
jgi:hypothetical protein